MYSLLDAFKGDYTQQAAHYEQRMRQLQTHLQGHVSTGFADPVESDMDPGLCMLHMCTAVM